MITVSTPFVSAIKSIQYGQIDFDASSVITGTATITAVVVAKSVLMHLGSRRSCTGATSVASLGLGVNTTLTLTNTTTVTADITAVTTNLDHIITRFCVVEYV